MSFTLSERYIAAKGLVDPIMEKARALLILRTEVSKKSDAIIVRRPLQRFTFQGLPSQKIKRVSREVAAVS